MFIFVVDSSLPLENRLITRLKIDGPFITFYFARKNESVLEDFATIIKKKFNAYHFLSYGIGSLHDYAHGHYLKRKEIKLKLANGFFQKTCHLHVVCNDIVNALQIGELLSCISPVHMPQFLKDHIVNNYQVYLNEPNLARWVTLLESYSHIWLGLNRQDNYFKERFPILFDVIRRVNEKISKESDIQNISDSDYLVCDHVEVALKKFYTATIAYNRHVKHLNHLAFQLRQFVANKIDLVTLTEIIKMSLAKAETMPIVSLCDLIPEAKLELKQHLHYPDLREAYQKLCEDMSVLLGCKFSFVSTASSENSVVTYTEMHKSQLGRGSASLI